MGGNTTFDYAHENESVQFRPVDYTHSQAVLARIERFCGHQLGR